MAILNPAQLTAILAIPGGDVDNVDLYVPAGYMGPVGGQMPNIWARACWNWALCGSMEDNDSRDTSPVIMYELNAPIDPFTDVARAAYPRNFVTEPNIGALWNTARGGAATDADRCNFMTAMGRVAARANGLTPVPDGTTPYRIHVTVPRGDWYHWQHWALSITQGGQTRFIQTEPNCLLNWGFTRIWEANRVGHLEASFFIQSIHQSHLDVIDLFLQLVSCRVCHRTKPAQTAAAAWQRCIGPVAHTYCANCGGALPLVPPVQKRRCNAVGCNAPTIPIADP